LIAELLLMGGCPSKTEVGVQALGGEHPRIIPSALREWKDKENTYDKKLSVLWASIF
jgi:hypothetical protein